MPIPYDAPPAEVERLFRSQCSPSHECMDRVSVALSPANTWVTCGLFSVTFHPAHLHSVLCIRAINGAIIPGGGQDLSPQHPFYDTSALLLNLTKAANDAGDFVPVRGVCSLPPHS